MHDSPEFQEEVATPCNDDGRESLISSFIPPLVKSRVPKIPSLRRSMSGFRGRSSRFSSFDSGYSSPLTAAQSRDGSQTRPISGDYTSCRSPDEVLPSRPVSSSSTLPVFPVPEVDSGVNWKYAHQGSQLLTQALQESSALEPSTDDSAPSFCRDLYVTSLNYLLRGLPSDLTTSEALAVKASLPPHVVDTIAVQLNQDLTVLPPQYHPSDLPAKQPSLLHRSLAQFIVNLFVIVHFLLPYIQLFLVQAYAYEREHRISERVLAASLNMANAIGRKTMTGGDKACEADSGPLGRAVNELVAWWILGVSGGIRDGFREGVVVLREHERGVDGRSSRR